MERLESAGSASAHVPLALELERQLHLVEKHYADARAVADRAREEWRALSIQLGARPKEISAARVKFEAIAARCARLLQAIEDLEDRIDAC